MHLAAITQRPTHALTHTCRGEPVDIMLVPVLRTTYDIKIANESCLKE